MTDSSDSEFEDLAAAIAGTSRAENDEIGEDSDGSKPEKNQKRRKIQDFGESKKLDNFLFGDKDSLIRNLEQSKTFFTDVEGIDETTNQNQEDVWHDSDDEFRPSTVSSEAKLKSKFERISGGTPSWARTTKKVHDDSSDDDEISKSVGHIKKGAVTSQLPKGELSFKRLTNINKGTMKEGQLTAVEFHPSSTVGIVAGLKGIVSLFAIDGRENKKIHNIKYEKFPIYSCKLNTNGDELVLGSDNPYFHTYNLITGYKQKTRLPKAANNLKSFQFSPCGKFMAIIGEFGEVHLLHTLTKEILCSFKQEYQSTSLSFSMDSSRLFSHSEDNEITVFSLRTLRVEHKFIDDGCVNGTSLAISSNGKFLATGSKQGFVNIYNYEDVFAKKYPLPVKAISNITTEISDLKFNPSCEILAMCSIDGKNAVKMVHFPSATVFSNFPSQHDNMGHAATMNFSPAGGFFSFGTISGEAPLYRLRHYNNY